MELNTTATKAALKHGIGDVTDTLKCLLRLVISCFLQGGHLHCRVSQTTSSPLSGSVRSHRAAEDTALPFHFHLCWSPTMHGRKSAGSSNGFPAQLGFARSQLLLKKPLRKRRNQTTESKRTIPVWSGPVHRKDTSAVQAPPKCKSNQFISIKAAVSDGADIQHFLRSPRQPGSATLINSY